MHCGHGCERGRKERVLAYPPGEGGAAEDFIGQATTVFGLGNLGYRDICSRAGDEIVLGRASGL